MNKKAIVLILSVALCFLVLIFGIIRGITLRTSSRMTAKKINAVYDYGTIVYSNKDFEKAIKAFEVVAGQDKYAKNKEDALFKLADSYQNLGKFEEARQCYKNLIQQFPNSPLVQKAQNMLENLNIKILFSPVITEDSFKYEIKPNDALIKIAKNFNTTVELLRKSNNLKNDMIIPGQFLKVTKAKFTILVDKSQNRLFLKKDGEIIKVYTISTGANFSTPVGQFTIEEKMVSPVWYKIGAIVSPDSADYELGKYWMGISEPGYGIHGTNDPASIGKHITKGCVRMLNADVEELYSIVPNGIEVVIVD